MKKVNLHYLLPVVLGILLISCDPDDNIVSKGEYENGVLVLNEGNYSTATGSVSYFNPSTKETQQAIFETKNIGKKLAVVQSSVINGDLAYIILNNGDRVQIVNQNTFADEGQLSGDAIVTPRYMTVLNDKAYLSVWGPYDKSYNLIDSYVLVFDLKSKSVIDTIDTGEGAENNIALNNKLYVSNSSDATISVADMTKTKDHIIKTIEVNNSPGEFVVDSNNKLWVICGGGYDSDYNALNDGALICINPTTNEVEKTIDLKMNVPTRLAINKTGDKLYFITSNKIFTVSTSATTVPSEAFITEADAKSFHGIAFDKKNDLIYAGNNKGYATNGNVFRYKADGTKIDNFDCGVAPNGFIIR